MKAAIELVEIEEELTNISLKPFIRWAGGKQNLVKEISKHIPKIKFNEYFEPFLGAGSLFLNNTFKKATLSDINPHLINCFQIIKDSPLILVELLNSHRINISPQYYYEQRYLFNEQRKEFNIQQAARFIFLIHSSYNGIFRVNKKGEYNVPFGKIKPAIPTLEHFLKIQEKLKHTILINCMYEDIFSKISKNDFIYLDPPYPALNQTSFFQHYTIDKFSNGRQEELANDVNILSKKGALILMSNAETDTIKYLYKDWNIEKIATYRYVNCKAIRKPVNELIIKNY